jgi:hypothetical protein
MPLEINLLCCVDEFPGGGEEVPRLCHCLHHLLFQHLVRPRALRSPKCNVDIKKVQNLMLISSPVRKLQKSHAKKVVKEKVTEKWSFLLLLLSPKVCRPITFLDDFFHFFQPNRTRHQILRFLIPMLYRSTYKVQIFILLKFLTILTFYLQIFILLTFLMFLTFYLQIFIFLTFMTFLTFYLQMFIWLKFLIFINFYIQIFILLTFLTFYLQIFILLKFLTFLTLYLLLLFLQVSTLTSPRTT